MSIRTNYKLTLTATVFLMAASQLNLVQAAGYPGSGQTAQPSYNPNYQNYAQQNSQYYDYGSTDHLTPGYNQPYYGGNNYRRGSNSSPWGGNSPSFSGPWSGGNGNSMPWNSGRGGSGPSFSGPWNSGNGNNMPWSNGNGNGNSMPWGW